MSAGRSRLGTSPPASRVLVRCSPPALVLRLPALGRMSSPPTPTGLHRRRGPTLMLAWAVIPTQNAPGWATPSWPPCAGRGCAATRSRCSASTTWTSTPAASRSSERGTSPHRAHRSPARAHRRRLHDQPAPCPREVGLLLRQPLGATRRALRGTLRPDDGGQGGPARRHRGRGHGSPLPPPLAPLLRHEPVAPGVDIHVVQRLLGHSNIATTTRYLHLSDTDLADAVDKAFPAE